MRFVLSTLCISVTLLGSGVAFAQEMGLGEFEYRNSCVPCHGGSGKGDGPVTDFLSGAAPPDLTVLQKNNGGVFPVASVYTMIEGSDVASVHGTRDMPIWGNRFRGRITEANDPGFSAAETETYARARVLALVDYLASIQQE